jgi:hypothetical protein
MVIENPQKEVINVKTLSAPLSKEEKHAHNEIAAVLTIVPGLGHIYKGHYEMGFLWMFLGMPIAIWVGILFGLATAGVGLIFPILCWAALAWDAYNEKDRRHHHRTSPWTDEDEPQD